MLDFDLGSLYPAALEWMNPPFFEKKPHDREKEKVVIEKLKLLNELISESRFAAGDHLTIADFSLLASVSTILATEHNLNQYPNIKSWITLLENELPYHKELIMPHIDALK
ncbi:glutathione S-transferase 1: isoform C-like protein, partial [Dinothrombium tinctorium]